MGHLWLAVSSRLAAISQRKLRLQGIKILFFSWLTFLLNIQNSLFSLKENQLEADC
jgi:hypothetical protein